MNKKYITLLLAIIFCVSVGLFFYNQIIDVVDGDIGNNYKEKGSRIKEYCYYFLFLMGLFFIWFVTKRQSKTESKRKSIIFFLKAILSSYVISFVFTALLIGLSKVVLNEAIFSALINNFPIIIFGMIFVFYPFVYRKLE